MKQQLEDYKKRFLESDDKFETIFNLTSAPSKIINSDLTIIQVNNAVTELLGFTAEEIEGTKILDYACPEFIAHWHQLQDALWSRKMPFFKLDACLIRKDKSVAWVNVTTVLFNQNNETFGFTVLEDITAKKQLEESKKRLDMALEYSKIAVWEINLNDFSVIRSKSHDGIFGYENPLVFWTKDTYRQHLLPEDFPEFEQAIASAKEKNGIDYKGRIYTVKKVLKWIHLQGKIEQDREVNLLKIIGTVKDIT
ncbi:MAG: PAS domain S-box protein, partial [Sphingobacteriaceae bacterium]